MLNPAEQENKPSKLRHPLADHQDIPTMTDIQSNMHYFLSHLKSHVQKKKDAITEAILTHGEPCHFSQILAYVKKV